jgi:hypothetical protein
LAFISALLLACGGGRGGDMSSSAPSTARGQLLQSPPELLSTVTASDLLLTLNLASNQQLFALSGAPVCDVLMYRIEYATLGAPMNPPRHPAP